MRIASLFLICKFRINSGLLVLLPLRPQLLDKRFQPSRITDHNRQRSGE